MKFFKFINIKLKIFLKIEFKFKIIIKDTIQK